MLIKIVMLSMILMKKGRYCGKHIWRGKMSILVKGKRLPQLKSINT